MGISLSQKLDPSFTLPHRLIASFGITDEIFAVASSRRENVRPSYMYGLILISFSGWSMGTLLGAAAGRFLPADITNAMGIVLYGMFIAIVVPECRAKKSVLFAASVAIVLSLIFAYPLSSFSFYGFELIISALMAAAIAALIFPLKDEDDSSANAESEAAQ
jgi:predicted branched-subunit amino acid permease